MSSARQQVLILNATRMGDLVQTVPLVARLHQNHPDVAIDLVVDARCTCVAGLIPGVRAVIADDLDELLTANAAATKDAAALGHRIDVWARPLRATGYDRVINLTFTRSSGPLATCLGVPDTRGVVMPRHGSPIIRNAWLIYFVDLLHYRRFNRFNLEASMPRFIDFVTLSEKPRTSRPLWRRAGSDRHSTWKATTSCSGFCVGAMHVMMTRQYSCWTIRDSALEPFGSSAKIA